MVQDILVPVSCASQIYTWLEFKVSEVVLYLYGLVWFFILSDDEYIILINCINLSGPRYPGACQLLLSNLNLVSLQNF